MEKDFREKTLEIVLKIPYGKVTTYGAIANAGGLKSSARLVGYVLNSLAGKPEFPCHRVVNRNGELTGRMHFATPDTMHELLESEGVEFIDGHVDMKKHFWEPEIMKSEN